MEGGGSYNLHAKIPAGGGNLALPWRRRLGPARSGQEAIQSSSRTYGSSQGKNSLALGLKLYSIFRSSGLSAPILRLDGAISGGPSAPSEALAEVVRSLLPAMERFGIATAAEVEIDSLAQRIRDEILAKDGVIVAPLLIGAWARHPG
jgi:hypothetical protein